MAEAKEKAVKEEPKGVDVKKFIARKLKDINALENKSLKAHLADKVLRNK